MWWIFQQRIAREHSYATRRRRPTDPNEPIQPPPPPDGDTVESVIPSSLSDAIYDSGDTAPDGKPIYVIDVTALPGGKLDPSGLLLGNDFIFRIEGGALRIAQN